MIRIELLCLLGLGACLSDTSGGEVGSETHFLSICVGHEDCPGDLSCLCGVCTTTCEDTCDVGSSDGGTPIVPTCARADSVAVQSFCGAARTTSLCLEACHDGCLCEDGVCLAEAGKDGAACTTDSDCAETTCTFGRCGDPCSLPDAECPPDYYCMVPGAVAGVCLPGVLEAFPAQLDGQTIALGTEKVMQLDIANGAWESHEVVRISVETLDQTPPTEVSVTQALPVTLQPGGLLTLQIRLAPSRSGPRPYRLVVRVAGVAPALSVPIDFVGGL